jgi:hypothetical protein
MNSLIFFTVCIAAGSFLLLIVLRLLQQRVGAYAPGWQVRCTKCGHTASAARAGVVRIHAFSLAKYTLGLCSHCKSLRVLAIERYEEALPRAASGQE